MEENIWLSSLDKNEALLLHDARNIELSEIDALISKYQSMLGCRASKYSPNSSP